MKPIKISTLGDLSSEGAPRCALLEERRVFIAKGFRPNAVRGDFVKVLEIWNAEVVGRADELPTDELVDA
jgi:hypothetical protein